MCTCTQVCSVNDSIYLNKSKTSHLTVTRKPVTFKTKHNLKRVRLGGVEGGETSGCIVRENTDISMIKNKNKYILKTHKKIIN